MGERVTVYVRLLGETVDVWRPVAATFDGNGGYRLTEEQPDGETWEFPPGSRVMCQLRPLDDGGEQHLVANLLLSDVVRQAGEVGVTITSAERSGDVTTVELQLDSGEWPFDPVAPATLWAGDEPVTELHKLVRLGGRQGTFESYDLEGEVPRPGGPFRMYSWFTKGQRQAITDATLTWRRATFNEPGDHTHCILTFEEINDGEEGYVAEPGGGWISVDAYEKYIRDDALRLRRSQ